MLSDRPLYTPQNGVENEITFEFKPYSVNYK